MSTQEKVVIVTGASQGIGAGLVEGYLERGFRVVANSRSIRPSTSERVVTVPGDIAEPATAQRVVETALQRFGRIDTLVNNAGIFIPKPFVEFTPDDFRRMISVNLAGFLYVSQLAARKMLEQRRGHIVNITTSLVEQPLQQVPAALTALTKGGLNAVTQSLAIEFASSGVRVNAVAPGIINTPMHRPEAHELLAGLHPMGRMGEIREIVDAVLYLETAEFVSGQVLHVDGAAHAGRW